ncbi:energy transducer TonB [Methylobacillus gramineus]|uniref:energy transducer TonB family protein n=1 Tax=Methylobacillus gramineus TaxID=755169 RepID=UPI001CFFCB04|nr:energy transducer TonB [Methylobacillus gramineus]MCB5186168.1 energy transducer TonB [Methylobacillus gramineus]
MLASTSLPLPSKDQTLVWAIIGSLALHAILVLQLPAFDFTDDEPPPVLTVELAPAPPSTAAPTPVAEPEPTKTAEPEPIKPPEPVKPPPKPTAVPQVTKPIQKMVEEVTPSKPTESTDSAPPATPAPEVMSVAPKEHVAPVQTTPTPTPPPPAPPVQVQGPSQQDMDAARNLYGSMLAKAISKYKQYPKIAQMRGWQGEVIVEVQSDGNGNVISSRIQKSSGHKVLDEQALTMVKKASPLPAPPEALRGKILNILVPIPFSLEES